MDKEALAAAGIDYDDGVRRCGGSDELYQTLLGMFLDDPNMAEARTNLENGDHEALFGNIHEIKGLSGNLSLAELYRCASHTTELLREGSYDQAALSFPDIEAAYDAAVAAIKAQQAEG